MSSGGQRMKYQHNYMGALKHFPWKFHWQSGQLTRFLGYSIIGWFPVFYWIGKQLRGPANQAQWVEIREKRKHYFYEPPKE